MKYHAQLLALITLFPLVAHGAQDISKEREIIRQWVQTERLISEEKSAWDEERQRMQNLLALYKKELTLLNEELKQSGTSAAHVDEEKQGFEKQIKEYREAQMLLSETMARLLPRVKRLIARFPHPLLEEISSEVETLNAPDARAHPRDVLKSTLAVLSSAARFNRSITVTEEIRTLDQHKKRTVRVIYLGLCRAYYTSRQGDTAGIGTPRKDGWQWTPAPELASDIRNAIHVYQKNKQPQLVKLPVKIESIDSK